jgi:hypothetical protein
VFCSQEDENHNYPPYKRPPKLGKGRFAWLIRAWHVTDTELINNTTPDELMLLRWYRMVYHWFFGATIFVLPVCAAMYHVDSKDQEGGAGEALGMKRITIAAANSEEVFWVVVLQMWVISTWLVYLLGRETAAYTRLVWRLPPAKVGIKSHAVLVSDIPMLTTDDAPGKEGETGAERRDHEGARRSAGEQEAEAAEQIGKLALAAVDAAIAEDRLGGCPGGAHRNAEG